MSSALRRPVSVAATAMAVLSLSTVVFNRGLDDWPQWRGLRRDGISGEKGLLKDWPKGGPPVAWRATGAGAGYSSFSTANGRLYTLGARGGTEYAMAFDASSGKKLWEVPHGRQFGNDRGDGPRATPTVEGDRLYGSARAAILRRWSRRGARSSGRSMCSRNSAVRTSSGASANHRSC
jgi:hypothetical protein